MMSEDADCARRSGLETVALEAFLHKGEDDLLQCDEGPAAGVLCK